MILHTAKTQQVIFNILVELFVKNKIEKNETVNSFVPFSVQFSCIVLLDQVCLVVRRFISSFATIFSIIFKTVAFIGSFFAFNASIENLKRVFLDRPMKPLDTAIFWIEYVIRNGNVLGSPSMDLTWWKNSLLDVYCLFFLSLLFVLYLCLVLLVYKLLELWKRYMGQQEWLKKKEFTRDTTKID